MEWLTVTNVLLFLILVCIIYYGQTMMMGFNELIKKR
jgi:hypothetical protein